VETGQAVYDMVMMDEKDALGGVANVLYHQSTEEVEVRLRLLKREELELVVAKAFYEDALGLDEEQRNTVKHLAGMLYGFLVEEKQAPESIEDALEYLKAYPVSLEDALAGERPEHRQAKRLLDALVEFHDLLSPKMRKPWLDGTCIGPDSEYNPFTAPYWFESLRVGAAPDLDVLGAFTDPNW
jgi:hypothetical protein